MCTNYRYARRKEAAPKPGRGETRLQGETDPAGAGKKPTRSKPAPVVVKAGKKGPKGAQKDEEEKPAEQVEAERAQKEDEEK